MLPVLKNKILIISGDDFIHRNTEERDKLFAELRKIYDGKVNPTTSNNIENVQATSVTPKQS